MRRSRTRDRCWFQGRGCWPMPTSFADAKGQPACCGRTAAASWNSRRISIGSPWSRWQFPNFRDGRAYSQARVLRERYRFARELRATGQVLRDQFLFLVRAGFDAFEVSKAADAQAFGEVMRRYSGFYQPGPGGARLVLDRRPQPPALAG